MYDEPDDDDGARVLVDRIWPRGMTKAKAALDEWCKDVAPSTDLRHWYSHDPAKFEEFARRYTAELQQPDRNQALQHLRGLAVGRRLTLLTATKNPDVSEAAVLAAILHPSTTEPGAADTRSAIGLAAPHSAATLSRGVDVKICLSGRRSPCGGIVRSC